MTSVELGTLKSKGRPSPHSVKQWQLNGTNYQPAVVDGSLINNGTADTRFSAWTPIINKSSNQQLFQERTTLILHWFDLWTDRQRKQFIHVLLARCSKSQLKFSSDWFMEVVPVTRVDFTAVLPRFLSLYILSFLNPVELCMAAQVCWHWRFLAEQDCLWSPKCVRRGWFLPYAPSDSEYGAWRRHYVACASSLDYLTPREAATLYGTLNETVGDTDDVEERRRERKIRQTIREKLVEHKRAAVKSRRAWLSNSWTGGTLTRNVQEHRDTRGLTAALVHLGDKCRSQSSLSWLQEKEDQLCSTKDSTLEKTWATTSFMKSLTMGSCLKQPSSSLYHPPLHLLLVSSRVPAYELVLSGARVAVIPLLYDHSGTTLETLLSQAERCLQGRRAQSLAVLAEGGTEEINLMKGLSITEKTILKPHVRDFWEKLCGWVVPGTEGGSLDIFVPLAASASGMELLWKLSSLTGLHVRAPTGICTGSYQHILSEWSGQREEFPPLVYLCEAPLLSWCRQAEWLEEALGPLREQLEPQLHQLCKRTRGRILGQFLCDKINLPDILVKSEVTQVLTEGLMGMSEEKSENPLEFLALFFQRKCKEGGVKGPDMVFLTESGPNRVLSPIIEVLQDAVSGVDRRTAVTRELLCSERAYVQLLQTIARVYYTPLRAALDSNRALLSSANVLMVFSPVLDILEVNNLFLKELTERFEEWGPLQCVGDICIKFCTKLRTYTNFFNNYPTILRTIDKCRGMLPSFRAFLKRHDRTLATNMLSLQELFLTPSYRVEECVTLLQALSLHTQPEHPDHSHVSSALNTLLNYRTFIHKLKKSTNRGLRMLQTQSMILSCPNLQEGNRYLITTQEVALLNCPNEDITPSLRMYDHVSDLGLFLFNDALLLSERSVSHSPFSHAIRTTHSFLASVALHSLTLRDITDTKYVQHAFALESPKRQWICATDREEEKLMWLSALRSASNAAMREN